MSLAKRALAANKRASSFGGMASMVAKKGASGGQATSFGTTKSKSFKIAMTGFKELDAELKAIAAESGAKSINKEMRRTTRDAMKQIVYPRVMSLAPFGSGYLRSQIRVRAIKRSRSKMGHRVGFNDPLFQGDTFYAGFLEYGFRHRSGTLIMGDSFLRRPLYESEAQVRSFAVRRLRKWIRERNR